MSKSPTDRIAAKSFSQVFEQMCNFVAVAKTGHPRETIKGLIQLCLLELPEERFGGAQEFADAIDTLFGVGVPEVQIEAALEDLVRSNVVACPAGTNFVLSTAARAQLESKVTDSRGLEERVKATWFESLARVHSDLALDTAWATLRTYLSRAFRRHGIQAAALLDPTIETPGDHSESLSVLLQEAVTDSFPEKDREPARQAISRFLAEVGADVDRSRYITQLADGAFNFYTLEVAPELASQLRAKLKPLTLFLDTNFLFGILDLHNNSQVEVSLELIRAVQVHKLPFKLRFHECTSQEMLHTISFYGDALRTRQWSRSLSRAATKTQNLSGIEMKFHEKNSGGLIDVDEFMRPYRHFDELLKEKGIQIYRPTDSRLQARADLHHEYQQFLDHCQRKDKAYSTVEHDVTVLDAVRQVRSNAKSTLEAGAILVSCDYLLYRFDWESARRDGHMACVMLPNTLWQLLRPFIPSDRDFDKSFAETFALPEFRAIGSGATKACSKMLGILAGYRDFPEETAVRLLCNGVLLDKLYGAKDDAEFTGLVEAAIADENAVLMEEKAALAQQLSAEKERRETRERELSLTAQTLQEKEKALVEKEETLREKENAIGVLEQQRSQDSQKIRETVEQVLKEEKERQAVEARSEQLRREKTAAERQVLRTAKIASVAVGVLVVLLFEVVIHSVTRWDWLLNHPNSYGLQGCLCLMVFFTIVGTWVRPWRKVLWGVGVSGVVFVLLQILGGPAKAP